MRVLGHSNPAGIDDATRKSLLPAAEKMLTWSAVGLIQLVNGVVLVRPLKVTGNHPPAGVVNALNH
jgi:hypothetical protein